MLNFPKDRIRPPLVIFSKMQKKSSANFRSPQTNGQDFYCLTIKEFLFDLEFGHVGRLSSMPTWGHVQQSSMRRKSQLIVGNWNSD